MTWIAAISGLMMAVGLASSASASGFQSFSGMASYYSDDYSGKTANGEQYDPRQFTAAHPTLPFGTLLRVSDPCNEHSITVVVTDRGPFTAGRVLDLSMAAAKALGMVGRGTLHVIARVEHVRPIHLRELLTGGPDAR